MAKFAYDRRAQNENNLYGMPSYADELGQGMPEPNRALMTPTGGMFDQGQASLTQPMPQGPMQEPPMQGMPQGVPQGMPQPMPQQPMNLIQSILGSSEAQGGGKEKAFNILGKLGDLMQNVGLRYNAMQGNQGAMNMLAMKQQKELAQRQVQKRDTTSDIKNYEYYKSATLAQGGTPKTFDQWVQEKPRGGTTVNVGVGEQLADLETMQKWMAGQKEKRRKKMKEIPDPFGGVDFTTGEETASVTQPAMTLVPIGG